MEWPHYCMGNRRGKSGSDRFPLFGLQNHCWQWLQAMKSEDNCFLAGKLWQTKTVCWKTETLLCCDAEAPVFWPPDMNRWLIEKVPDAGKDRGQKEKRASEDEMAGQHYWCNKHESNCANSGRWWGTRRPGMLQSMGLHRVRHDLATEQQQPPNELGSWEISVLF